MTPLHYASGSQGIKDVHLLARRGANVNAKGVDGIVPLPVYIAAAYGQEDIVQVLLSSGACVNSQNTEGASDFIW
ncbi:Tankyrase-1 [Fusarium odoratissimum]|uniref:Tankyrase-1 n=4 Tax=Fusarium oxysporum species complex TaxID=171631 RepID=N1RQ39_FUSC4|nr:uncharacterized protein FOIG_16699 [Fusarium odoratissimum NRRL 54006]EMT68723.1 Tankyrase-1 [Fusarium odoratissimum]ENH70224.1 Tankyrase-1 [Fusarium oxysporum f. sp. cubense race 1]EXL90021.1 hypothetical protein FOIG_16699 [Fusarium odoratissimum NRRL 54006]TXB98062.1 hypothetical protein FocTR4_00017202 [Fusarium oxysporum f. sp. cubense]